MKWVIFFVLLAWCALWVYLWRFAWTGLANKSSAIRDIISSLFCGLTIIALMIAFGWIMAISMDQEWSSAELNIHPAATKEPIGDSIIIADVSYYSSPEHGRKTASGEIFDSTKLTCATMMNIQFGRYIQFYNPRNGRHVWCWVNDRMPRCYLNTHPGRLYDISKAAAESLGIVKSGHERLEVKLINR